MQTEELSSTKNSSGHHPSCQKDSITWQDGILFLLGEYAKSLDVKTPFCWVQ